MIKTTCILLILAVTISCQRPALQARLKVFGETGFRITLNYFRELSDAELDSLEHSQPHYMEKTGADTLYSLLVKKGFVADKQLDTTGMHWQLLTREQPYGNFGNTKIDLDLSHDSINIILKTPTATLQTNHGPWYPEDILVTLLDLGYDGQPNLLVMTKFYIIGGYNFEIVAYRIAHEAP